MSFEVRPVDRLDLIPVVNLHTVAFPEALLTKLGKRFLERYYEVVLRDPNRIFLVAVDEGAIYGFVAGFGDPVSFYAGLRDEKWSIVRAITPTVFRRPWILVAVGRNYLWSRTWNPGRGQEPAGELASIAVDPGYQRQGVGLRLVSEFLEEATNRGWSNVAVTTDELDNQRVRRFYERLGFSVVGEVKGRSRSMVQYVKRL